MIKLLLWLLGGLKFLKFGKLLTTGGTMLLSIGAYALIFGWRYAVGFVGLIFLHEMGHYVAARRRGLAVGAPTFIPFVGAWVQLEQMPHDAETEAYVGIAGPLAGTLASLAVYYVARNGGDTPWLLALAYAGFFINLFNLIPLSPLDGGRITQVISPWLWLAGVPVLVAVFLWNPNPLLLIVGVLGLMQLWRAWKQRNDPEAQAYRVASLETRLSYGFMYVALLVFLAAMCHDLHAQLETLHPVRAGAGSS